MKVLMKSLAIVVAVVAFFAIVPVQAQSQTMTDEHVERIKSNCPVALATLGRIHANDLPQFINSNQTYFSVGDKMMARLNSRLSLNSYDASQLVKTASEFNEALRTFRDIYKTYDNTMSELVHLNCQRTPVTFYDQVANARQQRGEVHETVVRLESLIKQYREQVEDFKEQHLGEETAE